MDTLEFHPIAEWFPLMEGAALKELADDIQAQGLQESIKFYQGKILDGRNRYRACLLGGVTPTLVDVNPADPVAYVLSHNLHRRHLDTSQRAMIAAKAKDYYAEQASERQRQAMEARRGENGQAQPECAMCHTLDKGRSSDKAGRTVYVSGRTVDRATKVRKDGIPALSNLVEAGNLDVTKAARIASLPKETQETLLGDAQRNDWSPGMMMDEVKRLSPVKEPPKESKRADSPILQKLKFDWKAAGKEDRKKFLEWVKP